MQIDPEELVSLTQDLIKIPSVYRPGVGGNEREVAYFLARKLNEIRLKVVMEEVAPGRPNVIAILEGEQPGPCLMFECHTDVVTEGDRAEWTYDPFAAQLVNGRIYGRGACDTKGNLAAAILAVKAIKESKLNFKGKMIMGFLVDEEGMMSGVKHFIKQGWAEDVDAAIICEPVDNQLCIAQKGALRAEINTYGKMSHGAMPLAGFNPIPPMVTILERISKLEEEEIKRHGQDKFLGFPSITPTVLQAPVVGEPQLNVIPSQCKAMLDIRTIPKQSHDQLKDRLKNIVAKVQKESLKEGRQKKMREEGLSDNLSLRFSADLNIFEDRPWTITSKDEPIVQAVGEAIRLVTGREPIYNGVGGATDGTFLWAWCGIPIVTIGAGNRLMPHQKDEWIEIKQLVETAKIYAASAIKFLGAKIKLKCGKSLGGT